MEFTIWGSRGSIPSPGPDTIRVGGNTTCIEIITGQGQRIIIDAGTGMRGLGLGVIKEPEPQPITLLLTHSHWDHLSGFIFFPPAYSPKFELSVYGHSMAQDVLQRDIYHRHDNRYFPVSENQLHANISFNPDFPIPFVIDNVNIFSINLNHPGNGFGYRFEQNDHKIAFITDNELGMDYEGGSSQDEFIQFCKECDTLIHDAQYLPSEIETHKGWGHSTYQEVADLARSAGVPHIILCHHDPERNDDQCDKLLEDAKNYCKQFNITCELAIEGQRLTV